MKKLNFQSSKLNFRCYVVTVNNHLFCLHQFSVFYDMKTWWNHSQSWNTPTWVGKSRTRDVLVIHITISVYSQSSHLCLLLRNIMFSMKFERQKLQNHSLKCIHQLCFIIWDCVVFIPGFGDIRNIIGRHYHAQARRWLTIYGTAHRV